MKDLNVVWQPQAKQIRFMERPEYEVLYGGAAGGGKSDALLIEALRQVGIADYRAIIFRKTFPQLQELIDRSQILYKRIYPRAVYNESKHVWRFPSGAKIFFGSMQRPNDRINYQGRRYDFIGFDELTHFTWAEYSYMFSRNRPSRAPRSKKKTRCYIRATTNPGGIGHGWVKARFIDPAPPLTPMYETVTVKTPTGPMEIRQGRIFVPATVFDNRELLDNDPMYLARLASLPPKERDALLYGNWDSFEGQYFTEFRTSPDPELCREAGVSVEDAQKQRRFTHVIEPFDLSKGAARSWKIYRSYDFGYAKPFSCAWWAVDYNEVIYRIMELYGCTETPNEGVKWSPEQQFRKIREIETTHPWLAGRHIEGVADPAIWDASRGESIAETAEKFGVYFTPGDHKRIPGWMQCHYRLQFDENGYPRMYVFNTCKAFLRTIPLLVYSQTYVEDLDTSLEDHVADEWRYFCMSRPIAPILVKEEKLPAFDPLDQFRKRR